MDTLALAIKACHAGISIYFTTMADLTGKLKQHAESRRRNRGRGYAKSGLWSWMKWATCPSGGRRRTFSSSSSRAVRAGQHHYVEQSFTKLEEMFRDLVIAAAMLDRLLHHCRVINIKGNSYRMKGFKEQNSLIKGRPQVWTVSGK